LVSYLYYPKGKKLAGYKAGKHEGEITDLQLPSFPASKHPGQLVQKLRWTDKKSSGDIN
jgi:hypothetical protein